MATMRYVVRLPALADPAVEDVVHLPALADAPVEDVVRLYAPGMQLLIDA